MSFSTYKSAFKKKALENGFSEDNINKCLKYAEPIISNGFPVIYNTTHLSFLVGYKKGYLKKAALYTPYFYRDFQIDKKGGGKRQISEPLPSLREIQLWIYKEVLSKVKVSRYAKAYVPKRSIKDHARYHVKEETVLTLDIKNFFGSITTYQTEQIFLNIGYSKLVSNLLAKICTLKGTTPQGAPSSPVISNIVLKEFDNDIAKYCEQNSLKYTRYADDLAFSGDLDKDELIKFVEERLNHYGFELNEDKTRLMLRHQPQIVSGILVNEKTQVPKSIRKKIRQELYYIKTFGLESHLDKIELKKENYIKHLIGKINYLLSINPKDKEFLEYKKYLYSSYIKK
jgi:RNA-directed DNA polymerase